MHSGTHRVERPERRFPTRPAANRAHPIAFSGDTSSTSSIPSSVPRPTPVQSRFPGRWHCIACTVCVSRALRLFWVLSVFAGFMGIFRNVRGARRRCGGAGASAPSVHYVEFERDRGRSALATSGFQAHAWDSTRSTVTPDVERPGPDMPSHEDLSRRTTHIRKTGRGEHTSRPYIRHAHAHTAQPAACLSHASPHLFAAAAHIAGGSHGEFSHASSKVVY